MKKDTSWGQVADWYAGHVADSDSYHQTVIVPNLLRLMAIKPGTRVLDVACGSGMFAREFKQAGAAVHGIDLSSELIALARKTYPGIDFAAAPAHAFPHIPAESIDIITIILAIQNIREVKETLAECRRVLKPGGKVFIVMNHPAFRIPGLSSWQWDENEKRQYRRIDGYLTEKEIPIKMHPGADPHSETLSFHRPLQYYTKLITNGGFVIARLEEWISPKKSQSGPRQKEEDRLRKEIPLFMLLELALT